MTQDSLRPVDALVHPRFSGIRTFMRLPHRRDVLDEIDFAVVGFPFDTATAFRPGARFGPEAIRSASMLLRPYNAYHHLDLFDVIGGVDWGDLVVVPGDTPATYDAGERGLRVLVEAGVFSLVLGGDHSVTLPQLRALQRTHGPLALVQIDAHSDTGDEYYGQKYFHGTPFRRAVEEGLLEPGACIQLGLRGPQYSEGDSRGGEPLGFTVMPAEELRSRGLEECAAVARRVVGERHVFLTFDIDVLDPAFAPGTGVPEVGGLSTEEAVRLLRLLSGIRLVGADVVEVSPPYDTAGQQTAVAAANIAWELLHLHAVARRADRTSSEAHP